MVRILHIRRRLYSVQILTTVVLKLLQVLTWLFNRNILPHSQICHATTPSFLIEFLRACVLFCWLLHYTYNNEPFLAEAQANWRHGGTELRVVRTTHSRLNLSIRGEGYSI